MQCQSCQSEMRFIKAGVSKKTGLPYNAFWSCPNGCKQAPMQPQPPKPISPKPDWDAIAESKVKTHLIGSMLASGISNQDIATRLPFLVKLAMNGSSVQTKEVSAAKDNLVDLPF